MRRPRVVAAAVLGAVVLVAAPAVAAGPYPPPSKGSGQVVPSRIRVGECAEFSGDGFRPLTAVAITDNGVSRGTATTDVSGAFSKQLCYTSDAQKGRHTLAGTGTGADGHPLTVTAVLIVEGVRQSPGGGPRGSSGQAGGAASLPGGGTSATGGASSASTGNGALGNPTLSGATSGAAEAPPPQDVVQPVLPAAGAENRGVSDLLLSLIPLGLAFLSSLLLLLLLRRRRRAEDERDSGFSSGLVPA